MSLPSWDRFVEQGRAFRDELLPPGVPVLSVEAASTFGWATYADESIGIDRFGASAPGRTRAGEARHQRRQRGVDAHATLVASTIASNGTEQS